ncbi:hypothetical protein COB21_03355 [Candidatus Aerophobetes bacterium]|uniref:Uncharacterized protein n=1 Tax=Aerophobetes bacterium TaxID=2030807 RepID=A0A2A4X3U9_UNCAE|nr:MAG: hypothetical protein COB21_03355 [Candidatus Aerophobetes bacterium]
MQKYLRGIFSLSLLVGAVFSEAPIKETQGKNIEAEVCAYQPVAEENVESESDAQSETGVDFPVIERRDVERRDNAPWSVESPAKYDINLGPEARFNPHLRGRKRAEDFSGAETSTTIKGAQANLLSANVCPGAYCRTHRPGAGGRVVVDGSVYYFQPRVSGTSFVYDDTVEAVALTLPMEGNVYESKLSWNWGFNVGLGYNACSCFDYWTPHVSYTRLTTHGTNRVNASNGGSLIPIFASSRIVQSELVGTTIFAFCTSAKMESDFSFQSIDLSFSRSFFVSKRLAITPITALRGDKIKYSQRIEYTGGDPLAASLVTVFGLGGDNVRVNGRSDFTGIGPSFGLCTNWYFSKNISLVSKLSSSLLYGQFKINHKETYSANVNSMIDITADRHQFLPSVATDLGLSYDTCINKESCLVAVSLLWDLEYFWGYNQIPNGFELFVFSSDDLSIQSVKAEIKFSF